MAVLLRVAVATVAVLLIACRSDGPREILIVARGTIFTVPSERETPNPVLRVSPGERIQLTLRNDSPGLMHDFHIPALKVKTNQIRGGEWTTVEFTAPGRVGRYEYHSGPHAKTMRGFLEVTAQ
jgi:plastocyanin